METARGHVRVLRERIWLRRREDSLKVSGGGSGFRITFVAKTLPRLQMERNRRCRGRRARIVRIGVSLLPRRRHSGRPTDRPTDRPANRLARPLMHGRSRQRLVISSDHSDRANIENERKRNTFVANRHNISKRTTADDDYDATEEGSRLKTRYSCEDVSGRRGSNRKDHSMEISFVSF